MTLEELNKVTWVFVAHMSMEKEHLLTYRSKKAGRLGFCQHTKRKKNADFGKSYRHYRFDNKYFETLEEFLEAIKEFNEE